MLGQTGTTPDPPRGHGLHRYAFQLFALRDGSRFKGTPGRDDVLHAIRAHGIAGGLLVGTYERPDGRIKSSSAQRAMAVDAAKPTPD